MAVRSKEELIEQIKTVIGDNTSDNAIALIEDVTDTVTQLETNDSEDWKQKFEDNDKMWREKYIARFTEGTTEGATEPTAEPTEETEEEDKELTFDELFEEEKEC